MFCISLPIFVNGPYFYMALVESANKPTQKHQTEKNLNCNNLYNKKNLRHYENKARTSTL